MLTGAKGTMLAIAGKPTGFHRAAGAMINLAVMRFIDIVIDIIDKSADDYHGTSEPALSAFSILFAMKTRNLVKYFVIFLLLLAIVLFSLALGIENSQVINVNFLLARGQFRVSTLLATLFAAGFIIGWLICGLFYLRTALRLARADKKIRRLQQQLTSTSASTHSVRE